MIISHCLDDHTTGHILLSLYESGANGQNESWFHWAKLATVSHAGVSFPLGSPNIITVYSHIHHTISTGSWKTGSTCSAHLYPHGWAQCLAQSRCSINICWMGEWMNESVSWVRNSLETSIIGPRKQRQSWHILENVPSLKWFKCQSPWVKRLNLELSTLSAQNGWWIICLSQSSFPWGPKSAVII